MISDYFEAPWALKRLRASSVGAYVDGFARALTEAGYSRSVIREYLCAVANVGEWADRLRIAVASFDDSIPVRFRLHLSRRKRLKRCQRQAILGIEQFLGYLRSRQVIAPAKPAAPTHEFSPISVRFATWMLRHRGLAPLTVHTYQRSLAPFLTALGEEPEEYDIKSIKDFIIARLGSRSRSQARQAVTAIRAFFRFLVAEGRLPSGIVYSVPTVPQWRLSSLPRYLEAPDVERVVGCCDLSTAPGLRDHAILLLLARLGLRGGDVVAMTLDDIEWKHGTLKVRGKGRREVLLPLPQDVGDAILAYLKRGRPKSTCDRMFLTASPPIQPFTSCVTVSHIVRRALQRAGIQNPPTRGAHLLRHSAATAMLRSGSSLDTIATVLRHQSLDTTAHYAKVDLAMLEQVVQPWPGGESC